MFCVSLELLKFYVPKFTCCTPHGINVNAGGECLGGGRVFVGRDNCVYVGRRRDAKVLWFATHSVCVFLLHFRVCFVYASFVVVFVVIFVVTVVAFLLL